jgi:predicted porin
MNKTALIAAIVAAFGMPACAQSSVTLYGRLNVTVESVKHNDADRESEIANNSSRIGFKGTEDLGGGLKAGFQIEHGFDPTTGTAASAFWGRQAEVNLSGGFGTVRLGTFFPDSYYATSDYIGMHNHETGDSADAFYTTKFVTNNKVGYISPNLSGFVLHGSVAEGAPGVERTYDLAAYYDAGPLHLGGGFEKQGDFKQFAIRGLYEMGPVTLGAYVQRATNVIQAVTLFPLGSATHFRISVMYVMGPSEFHLNVGRAGEYTNLNKSDAVQSTLGYNYNLSKRTKVYGYYTRIDKDEIVRAYGGNADALALGVRHNF